LSRDFPHLDVTMITVRVNNPLEENLKEMPGTLMNSGLFSLTRIYAIS
jgi:hypothetical protein